MTRVDIVKVKGGWQTRIWFPNKPWLSPFVEQLKTSAVITAMNELQDMDIDTFEINVIAKSSTSKEN